MDTSAQQKILADIERRWSDAVVDEKHRERAKLLVRLLQQVMEDRGEVPAHHHGNLRAKVASLASDLHRMTTNEMVVVSRAIKLVGDALPDSAAGTGFHKPLEVAELNAIRAKHPVMRLQKARPDKKQWEISVAGSNGNGSSGNGAHEAPEHHEADPDVRDIAVEPDPDHWVSPYNPLLGPGQRWTHRPRRQYMF